jgi:hypothetical protein
MRTHESNENNPNSVIHRNYQSVLVSAYVKNNPLIADNTRMPVLLFNLRRILPFCLLCLKEPGAQSLLRIMPARLLPKIL